MDYLPLCFRLEGRPVLLVGGGTVALRKARLLSRAGASLRVLAPDIEPELSTLLASENGEWIAQPYSSGYLSGCVLAVAATPDTAVNQAVHDEAQLLGVPVNVVDTPALCTFIFPAIIDRNPLLVAVSSSGASPVLARQIRRQIESMLPAAYGRLAAWLGRQRDRIKAALPQEGPRRLFWEQLTDGPAAQYLLAGREDEAERCLAQSLEAGADALSRGEVYLIGAGPGDPDLLTFKALRLLQRADVVLYDRLVNPLILDMARRDADRVYVGKRRAEHAVPQQAINERLLELARAGKRVARLKGGDPFIFGRGGEEIELLARHNIPFQVVPGITAASGAACYGGIPLTHRDHAQSVRFVAGYLKGHQLSHQWENFLSPTETLVFYMGLMGLAEICTQLQAHGRSADTPVALVERATLPDQRTHVGTLSTIIGVVEQAQVQAPTLIIVGEVVRLQGELDWFGGSGAAEETG